MTDDIPLSNEEEQLLQQLASQYGQQLGNFPEPPNKDTLLQFMRDVVKEEQDLKISKTANFRDEEVGRPKVPVLAYAHIAAYADTEGYDKVGNYLRKKAGLVATLSLGRKAKLLETLFTVRRETRHLGTPREIKKKGWLGDTTVKEGMES